ncbi:MAG TPA: type I methionyl aminopeptidase [Actinomycetes bacterium]|nr:type I methionyl aminopeptidase [Actinomycetes bacterium]
MITRKSPEQVDRMRRAGRLVGHTLSTLVEAVRPGVTLLELDAQAERVIRDGGGIPSFLGYHGFPATLCLSPNDWIVHGIPNGDVLKEGDILSIDCGAIVDGWHGDAAVTVPVGQVDDAARRLIETTERAMWAGIAQVRAGNRLSDIGHAVEKVAAAPGYGVVREYVGHGIGTRMHEEPQVPNYGRPGRGLRLEVGHVLAIEPMVNEGSSESRVLDDGWTVVTRDGSRSAHFEHTVAITPQGPEVLTLLDGVRQDDWLPTAAQRR